jgi:hypothetical protein
MLPTRNHCTILCLRIAALALLSRLSGVVLGQDLPVEAVQRVPVITVGLRVGCTEKKSKRVTYTPPPGWYIRSHTVNFTHRYGNTSCVVSTVPAGWTWASEKNFTESNRHLIDMTLQAHDIGGQGHLQNERDALVHALRTGSSSHHALIVDVTANGEGLFRHGSEIELTVIADLVYVGMDVPQLDPFPRITSADRAQKSGSAQPFVTPVHSASSGLLGPPEPVHKR